MWVRFVEQFHCKPTPRITITFRAGQVVNVRRLCGDEAVRQGKAVPLDHNERGGKIAVRRS